MQRTYSDSLKRKVVQRLLLPGAPSLRSVASEAGLPPSTIYRWVRNSGSLGLVSEHAKPKGPRRPEDWKPEERLRAITESNSLSGEALGEFLRREGLHEETLDEWREAALEGLRSEKGPAGSKAERKRIRSLERELQRKEKALAEAATLLVLKKKAQEIWGDEDDDTTDETEQPSSGWSIMRSGKG